MIFEGNVTGEEIFTVPEGREEIRIYTDADLTVSFFSVVLNSWGEEIQVTAPGGFVGVCGTKARATGTARVIVL